MGDRLALHQALLEFMPNVYFQPPSNIQMVYPCIVYSKSENDVLFGNDKRYLYTQGYQLMLIERIPDSSVANAICSYFQYCAILQYYTVDNLNHTTIKLYY